MPKSRKRRRLDTLGDWRSMPQEGTQRTSGALKPGGEIIQAWNMLDGRKRDGASLDEFGRDTHTWGS